MRENDGDSPRETGPSGKTGESGSSGKSFVSQSGAGGEKREPGILLSGRKRTIPLSSIDVPDRSGRTFIFKYAGLGDVQTCLALLRAGAAIDRKDHAGWTPLHEACLEGRLEIVRLLLEHGADANVKGGDCDTPLHDAAQNGHDEVVKLLLQFGADFEAQNDQGSTPVDVAETESVRRLLLDWKKWSLRINTLNQFGQSELHIACATGNLSLAKELLAHGADVNALDFGGWSPLHEAALHGYTEIVALLLEYSADPNLIGETGDTCLSLAVQRFTREKDGNEEKKNALHDIIKLVLQYGADPSITNKTGFSPQSVLSKIPALASFGERKFAKFRCHILEEPFTLNDRRISEESNESTNAVESQAAGATGGEEESTNQNHLVKRESNEMPPPSQSSATSKQQLSREERKFLALLRTIENMENDEPLWEDYTPKPRKRSSSITVEPPVAVAGGAPGVPVKRKRGRPRKNPLPEENTTISFVKKERESSADEDFGMGQEQGHSLKRSEAVSLKVSKKSKEEPHGKEKSSPRTLSSKPHVTSHEELIKKREDNSNHHLPVSGNQQQFSGKRHQPSQPAGHVRKTSDSMEVHEFKKPPIDKPIIVVKKKTKKKNWLGISGYQDMETLNDEGAASDTANTPVQQKMDHFKASESVSSISIDTAQPVSSVESVQASDPRKCTPLYAFRLADRSLSFVDLQIGLFMGLSSGRDLLDKYPHIRKQVATPQQKTILEQSPISQTILTASLFKYGDGTEASCRWIKTVTTSEGAKGMKLSDVDIQLLSYEDVIKAIPKVRRYEIVKVPLDDAKSAASSPSSSVVPKGNVSSSAANAANATPGNANSYVHKLKRIRG